MIVYETLKRVPAGTKLYSPICGEVESFKLGTQDEFDAITVFTKGGDEIYFYKDGRYCESGEVLLFPSRENRDWEKFAESLKPVYEVGKLYYFEMQEYDDTLKIIGKLEDKNEEEDSLTFGYQLVMNVERFDTDQAFDLHISIHPELRPATEEECEHFKNAMGRWANSKKEHKFKTFDEVLVRKRDSDGWLPALYCRKDGVVHRVFVITLGIVGNFANCTQYKGHEHLAYTNNPETDLPF